MLKKTYITFGQVHVHSVEGMTFDKDCVACIIHDEKVNGRDIAFELFSDKWHQSYTQERMSDGFMKYYPRGIIEVQQVFYPKITENID